MVVPALDEENRIGGVLAQILKLRVDLVIPVINGSTDDTMEVVRRIDDPRIWPLFYPEPLGLDVPRCAGARLAVQKGAKAVLFVDGDLKGDLGSTLWELLAAVQFGVDLALMDCYLHTERPRPSSVAGQVYAARLELNRLLRRPDLGVAMPSHGPSSMSRRLLERVPLWTLGMPPVLHALAAKEGLRVEVAARLPHRSLGSAPREPLYRKQVAHTIIGDCIAAQAACNGEGLTRRQGALEFVGLHDERRWDLLGLKPRLGRTAAAPPALPASPASPASADAAAAAPDPAPGHSRRRRRRRKSPEPSVGTIPSQSAPVGQPKRGGVERAGERFAP